MKKQKIHVEQNQNILIQNDLEVVNLSEMIDTSKFQEKSALFLVKLTERKIFTGLENRQEEKTQERIVNEDVMNQLLKEPQLIHQKSTSNFGYTIYTQEALEQFRDYGRNNSALMQMADMAEATITPGNAMNLLECGKGVLVEYVSQEESFPYISFMNKEGEYFVEPIHIDYISGGLNNENYHLDDVVEYLTQLPNLIFVAEQSFRSTKPDLLYTPLTGNEKGIDRLINDIPSYNATEECSEKAEFYLRPTQAQIEQITQWKRGDSQCYQVQQFILQEVLEAKKFMKHPVVQEETKIPTRKFKR